MNVLTAIKKQLEKPEKGAATAKATLKDLMIVTWALPEEVLRPRVPEALPLDRLPGPDGAPVAFLQLVSALHSDTRWSPLPATYGESFHRAALRVLVRPEKKPGAFVLHSYVNHPTVANAHFPLERSQEEARFVVHIGGDPARAHFERYGLKVTTDSVQIQLSAERIETPETTPLGAWQSLTTFLTQRTALFHEARLPKGGLTVVPIHHAPLTPQAGRLKSARIAALEGLELPDPLAVHFQPTLTLTSYPPRLWSPKL